MFALPCYCSPVQKRELPLCHMPGYCSLIELHEYQCAICRKDFAITSESSEPHILEVLLDSAMPV